VPEFQEDLHNLVHQPKQFHKVVDTEDMEVMELVQFLVDMVLESLVDLHKLMP
jgi:hypothetical protein